MASSRFVFARKGSTKNIPKGEEDDKEIARINTSSPAIGTLRRSNVENNSSHVGQLFEAVQSGKVSKLAQLIKKNSNIEVIDEEGDTLYHYCASSGSVDCMKLLIDTNKNFINEQGWMKYAPLHIAALNGKEDCLKLLIEHKANIDAISEDGSTPLHLAARNGHKECVVALLEAGCSINALDKEKATALIKAARYGRLSCLQALLDREDVDISAKMGPLSYNAILWAASSGHFECVDELLDETYINSKDRLGNTLLHVAAMNGHSPVVRYLLEKGLDQSILNNYHENALHLGCFNGHYHTVLVLLLENSEPQASVLNAKDDKGMTPLHRAVEGGNIQIVSKLVDYKVDINAKDKTGNTALHIAAKQVITGLSEILLTKGCNVDVQNEETLTPLHVATVFGNLRFVEEILEKGAKVNIKTKDGKDAYDLALKFGRSDIAALLNKKSSQATAQKVQLQQESSLKLRSEVFNLVAENQKLSIKLRIMDRQAEMEYLEKQKLLMEIAMLKAENNSLHEKLKTQEKEQVLSPAVLSPVNERTVEVVEPINLIVPITVTSIVDTIKPTTEVTVVDAKPQIRESMKSFRRDRASMKLNRETVSGANFTQTLELLQTQNQILRTKVLSLTEEVTTLESQLFTFESKRLMTPTQLRFGRHRNSEDSHTSANFDEDDFFKGTCEDIVFTKEIGADQVPQIKAATPDRLVQRLTYQKHPDVEYMIAFLLTYRSFMSPIELLEKLILRYCLTPPSNLKDDDQIKNFIEKVQTPVKLRVINVMKHWIEGHFYDFEDNEELVKATMDFLQNTMEKTGYDKQSEQIKRILQKMMEGGYVGKNSLSNLPHVPPSIIPTQDQRPLLDWSDVEIARQMTLIDYNLFSAITPKECMNQAWLKKDGNASNIRALTGHFNKLGQWVWNEIISTKDIKERATLLSKFISIAKECFRLNNYNSCISILSGLQHFTVYRLKKTWDEIDDKSRDTFEDLSGKLSSKSNWAKYREILRYHTAPPCLPFLGVYLTDLVFIDEGNPDKIKGNLINFYKRRKISILIRDIQQYQNTAYHFAVVPSIHIYLISRNPLLSEDEGYKYSMDIEPREN